MTQQQPAAAPPRAGSPRRTFAMTIVAQDPSVGDDQGMLRATVPVPADRLDPGPRSHRFQVIDYDATARVLTAPATLTSGPWEARDGGWDEPDRFSGRSDTELLSDPAFHAQNVYAIAARKRYRGAQADPPYCPAPAHDRRHDHGLPRRHIPPRGSRPSRRRRSVHRGVMSAAALQVGFTEPTGITRVGTCVIR